MAPSSEEVSPALIEEIVNAPPPSNSLESPAVQRIQRITASAFKTGNLLLDKTKTKVIVTNVLKWILTISLLIGVSIFSWSAFYSAIMPREIHEDDINFQFTPCNDRPGPCSHPNASLRLNPGKHKLQIGQAYRIGVIMELPDSYKNQVISSCSEPSLIQVSGPLAISGSGNVHVMSQCV